jgi:hypothetical protein
MSWPKGGPWRRSCGLKRAVLLVVCGVLLGPRGLELASHPPDFEVCRSGSDQGLEGFLDQRFGIALRSAEEAMLVRGASARPNSSLLSDWRVLAAESPSTSPGLQVLVRPACAGGLPAGRRSGQDGTRRPRTLRSPRGLIAMNGGGDGNRTTWSGRRTRSAHRGRFTACAVARRLRPEPGCDGSARGPARVALRGPSGDPLRRDTSPREDTWPCTRQRFQLARVSACTPAWQSPRKTSEFPRFPPPAPRGHEPRRRRYAFFIT